MYNAGHDSFTFLSLFVISREIPSDSFMTQDQPPSSFLQAGPTSGKTKAKSGREACVYFTKHSKFKSLRRSQLIPYATLCPG